MKKIQTDQNIIKTLNKIYKLPILKNFYLAGGTALAFLLNHRASFDLDLFTSKKNIIKKVKEEILKIGKVKIIVEDENTLILNFNNTRLSFFYYPYPLLFKPKKINGVKLADERDISAMKISAISGRGSKKDFIDIYFLLKKYNLDYLLKIFEKKFKKVKYNKIHILKSLVYFKDAEKEPMPKMIKKVGWQEVKKRISAEVMKTKQNIKK
jgi:hypothetical protein